MGLEALTKLHPGLLPPQTVVACVRTPERDQGKLRRKEIQTFPTSLKGLEALRAWLAAAAVTAAAAMEATGVDSPVVRCTQNVWAVAEVRGQVV